MTSLGQLLSENIKREADAKHNSELAIEVARTEKERQELLVVQGFFAKARDFFMQSITARKPVDTLFLQLGGTRYSQAPDYHEEVARTLATYQYTTDGPRSLLPKGQFSAFWAEFQTWARAQGLDAYWSYQWSGGGEDSWFQLRVRPLK